MAAMKRTFQFLSFGGKGYLILKLKKKNKNYCINGGKTIVKKYWLMF